SPMSLPGVHRAFAPALPIGTATSPIGISRLASCRSPTTIAPSTRFSAGSPSLPIAPHSRQPRNLAIVDEAVLMGGGPAEEGIGRGGGHALSFRPRAKRGGSPGVPSSAPAIARRG